MRPRWVNLGGRLPRLRSQRVRAAVLDGVVAAVLWAVVAFDLATRPLEPGQMGPTAVAYLLAGAIAIPFVFHRRFPVVAMLVSTSALIGYAASRFSAYPGYATFALVFGVGLHVGRRRGLLVYLLGVAGLAAAIALQPAGVANASTWISNVLTITVAWLAGENLRARRTRREQELVDARRLARQRVDEGRRAVAQERLRIARDLHDVVAHSMSVIAVQAGVANHVIDERPELARQALGSIEVTARAGLVEMRRLLGVLRSEELPGERAGAGPAEGLRDLAQLLEQFRAAGLTLDVAGQDDVGDLPPALDISAYRIVQEALTNVLRHGGPTAELTIRRSDTALGIEVRDSGRSAGPVPPGSADPGHGLTGIRERTALFGGTVAAGPQPDGGFSVAVQLPIAPVAVEVR